MTAPLDGVLVVDFSQFLAGPYASLRLQDLGARVIKVENPDRGDLCRYHYLSETRIGEDSTLFHAINRGKESVALDLKSSKGRNAAEQLVASADVMIQNFRPGVIDRLGLGYDAVRQIKPDIIYGSISGYGSDGEWAGRPGQDLLAQARSGIMWLSGNAGPDPVPAGLPIADISAGANLAQGLLGALFRHARTGSGAHVETSLLESLVDLQFEFFATYLNNGRELPQRLEKGSAHGYLPAPYGVFETTDDFLALAMTSLTLLADALQLPPLLAFAEDPSAKFHRRNELHESIADRLLEKSAAEWEDELGSKGLWCAKVLTWPELLASEAFQGLDLVSRIETRAGEGLNLVRAPIRIDGDRAPVRGPGPELDADGSRILNGPE